MVAKRSFIGRVVSSGMLAGTAAALAASFAGRREVGAYAAPLNATSHILWGDAAARRDSASAKYTGTGALLHYGAAIFWALLYEALPGRAPMRAAATAVTAYVVDYHVVPRRLTPGFEMRLSAPALAGVYLALGLGLWAASIRNLRVG
jgi:hypothetical protein